MPETIYTLPINEAFDACEADRSLGCPLCRLAEQLEREEIDLILGASMMEPEIRQRTNEEGFCRRHLDQMLTAKNRLGLALILESRLDTLRAHCTQNGAAALLRKPGAAAEAAIARSEHSCYVCGRIEGKFEKMTDNTVYLWDTDDAFRRKFASQPLICLPHYRRLLETARGQLDRRRLTDFLAALDGVTMAYFDALREDVSRFCRKFDYRSADEPWGTAKDAPDRAVRFLKGDTF